MSEKEAEKRLKALYGKNFRKCREKRKWSHEYTGEVFGVGKTIIQNWETGQDFPETWRVFRIAEVYDVSLDWMFGRKNFVAANGSPSSPSGSESLHRGSKTDRGDTLLKRKGA